MNRVKHQTITVTSPAAASASPTIDVHTTKFQGLDRFCALRIDAALTGATGGTLDVYLQRLVYRNPTTGAEVWADWCHFEQIADGAAVTYRCVDTMGGLGLILTVGFGDVTSTTPALAAGTCIGCHPGSELRIAFVAGAGSSAGAAQTFYLTGFESPQ